MFALKTSTRIGIISLIILSLYTLNTNADTCSDVKAKSEVARVSAEDACAKAAGIAINSADTTKAVAKKACDDAKIIAKNVADNAAFAACPPETATQSQQNVSTTEPKTAVETQTATASKDEPKTESEIEPEKESDACTSVKAKSEAARISAEDACVKAAQVAINSAEPTKAIAKKACDDAKIIAKNVADTAAAAVCPVTSTTSQQNTTEAQQPKHVISFIRRILFLLRLV